MGRKELVLLEVNTKKQSLSKDKAQFLVENQESRVIFFLQSISIRWEVLAHPLTIKVEKFRTMKWTKLSQRRSQHRRSRCYLQQLWLTFHLKVRWIIEKTKTKKQYRKKEN